MDKQSWIEKNVAGVKTKALHPLIGPERHWRGGEMAGHAAVVRFQEAANYERG
jgi:hypothetical protein